MIEGRRVTCDKTIDVVTMVYAGLINKQLVCKLQALTCNAIGLTGADLNSISAVKRKHDNIDFGWVGDVVNVNSSEIIKIIQQGYTPKKVMKDPFPLIYIPIMSHIKSSYI